MITKDPQKPLDMHMQSELMKLMEPVPGPCISLYAPMEEGNQARQNSIRVHNLLRQAGTILAQRDHSGDEISQWLMPVEKLLADDNFWQNQKAGFAAFLSPNQTRHFELALRVPELVFVGHRFHLKPLLPIFNQVDRFYLLTMSQHRLRLFDCSPGNCQLLPLPDGMPNDIDAANLFEDTDGAGQARNQMTDHRDGRSSGFVGASGTTHGIGMSNEELEEFRLRFLRQISENLTTFLHNQHVPLMLAGVDDLIAGFRKELSYSGLLTEHLSGNFDRANANELLEKAWPLARIHFKKLEQEAVAGYSLALASQLATSDLEQVLPAAVDGRISTLFVARGHNMWGKVSQQGRTVERLHAEDPEACDLLDVAAMETLQKGGQVFALESDAMPDHASPVSAILRY
jgi:hypothetical protein